MIFHDVKKAAKGILKDFAQTPAEEGPKKPIERRLHLSTASLKVEDFRTRSRQTTPESEDQNALRNTIRLSPFTAKGGAVSAETGAWRGIALVLLGLVIGTVVLLGYSAWNAAGTEVAYAREGLSRIVERISQVRTLYAEGKISDAGKAFSDLSDTMEDFTLNLQMRLLLPRTRTGMTDTELPAATLDFVSHSLSALRHYRQLYDRVGNLTDGKTGASLMEMRDTFDKGTAELGQAQSILASLRTEGMPPDLKLRVNQASAMLTEAASLTRALQAEMPALLDALGASYPRRYAVLLQNADEMRPTGGFIGGVLFVDVNDGRLTGSEYFDVYELDWRLPSVEPAPDDLAGISPEYGLRDSNRFADFPRSAREALSFFEKQGIPTVDGVIAINQHLLEEIISATGPIRSPSISVELTGANVTQALSLLVESKRNPEKPKAVIKELVPTMMERVSDQPVAILRVLSDALRRGNIAAYAVEPSVQAAVERSGLSGTPRTPTNGQDYLMLTESNVGGNKSDRYVTEQVSHLTSITPDGTRDTLRIVRQHGFGDDAARSVRELASRLGIVQVSDTLMAIMGKGQNKTIIRVAVPKGSILLSTEGIPMDIVRTTEDGGKAIFSFPMNVSPGNVVDATLSYALPGAVANDGRYELLIDKQIGQKAISYDKRLQFATPVTIEDKMTTEYGRRIDLDRSTTFSLAWE